MNLTDLQNLANGENATSVIQVIQDSKGKLHAIDSTLFGNETVAAWEQKILNAGSTKSYSIDADANPSWAKVPVETEDVAIVINKNNVTAESGNYDPDNVKVGDVFDIKQSEYKDWNVYLINEDGTLTLTPRVAASLKDHEHSVETEEVGSAEVGAANPYDVAVGTASTDGNIVVDVHYETDDKDDEVEPAFVGKQDTIESTVQDIKFTPVATQEGHTHTVTFDTAALTEGKTTAHSHELGGSVTAAFAGNDLTVTSGTEVLQKADVVKPVNNFLYNAAVDANGVLSFSYAPVQVSKPTGDVTVDATKLSVKEVAAMDVTGKVSVGTATTSAATPAITVNEVEIKGAKASATYTPAGDVTIPEIVVEKAKATVSVPVVTVTPVTVVKAVKGITTKVVDVTGGESQDTGDGE